MSKSRVDSPSVLPQVAETLAMNNKQRNPSFAGRIGGNQQFTVSRDDPEYERIKSEIPDATADVTWREIFSLQGFWQPEIWRSGLIELWGK